MRFPVLTATSIKVTVFLDVAPCGLVEVYRRFRGACCLHDQGVGLIKIVAIVMKSIKPLLKNVELYGWTFATTHLNLQEA
jgi:hypothetical protein